MLDIKSFAENTLIIEQKFFSNIDRPDHIQLSHRSDLDSAECLFGGCFIC